jgi:hypothetical protein
MDPKESKRKVIPKLGWDGWIMMMAVVMFALYFYSQAME